MTQLKHAILGAGGIGGLMGASLARSGAPVTLVVRRESLPNYPKQLRLDSPFGNVVVDVSIAAEVPPTDVLWLTVKATELGSSRASSSSHAAVKAIEPLVGGGV